MNQNKMVNIYRTFFGLTLLLCVIACNQDDNMSGDDPCHPNFDQAAFFTHVADDIIIPGYEKLNVDISSLQSAATTFTTELDAGSLENLKSKYTEAYKSWQVIAQYEFGPAASVFLRNSINNFPLNEEAVLENVQTGTYDFNMPDRYDKGLPALDFLLFGIALDQNAILNQYILGSNAEKYRNYLLAIVDDMNTRSEFTLREWQQGYRDQFIGNTGTAAGTSLSLLVNGLNENYELIKREKLGVPSGVLTLGIPNPDRVEALHSGLSTTLLQVGLQATIDLFSGTSFNHSAGIGFDDYLDAAHARKADTDLSTLIDEQFIQAKLAVANLDAPLNTIINSDKQPAVDAYNEITRQLVNLKTDMPSVLCVSITYIDNPSDSD